MDGMQCRASVYFVGGDYYETVGLAPDKKMDVFSYNIGVN
jgi:hypothetical protein